MEKIAVTVIAFLLSSCTFSPGLNIDTTRMRASESAQKDLYDEADTVYEVTPITAALIKNLNTATNSEPEPRNNKNLQLAIQYYQYLIAPQDVLSITVWNHPELTTPAGQYRSAESTGYEVTPAGTIFYPYVGNIHVAGRTVSQVQDSLTKRLRPFIRNPQLAVSVAAFRGQHFNVTGEVTKAGAFPITDAPVTALDAINQSLGLTVNADAQNVTLARDGKLKKLDILALTEKGDLTQNVLLQNGDILNVPDQSENKVFVLGEVNKQSAAQMHKGRMSLAEAISGTSEGLSLATADQRQIYIIRGNFTQPQIYRLNAAAPNALLLASAFQLRPHDVVYVSSSGVTRWNRVLNQLLPSVQSLILLKNR